MYIKIDKNNNILGVSKFFIPDSIKIDDSQIPDDFEATFGLGKYFIKNNKIHENPKFVMPARVHDKIFDIFDQVTDENKNKNL